MTTDADILARDGVASSPPVLRLENGNISKLYFGYPGLKLIEKNYGSVTKLMSAMADEDGAMYTALIDALAFGSWKAGLTVAEIEQNLDPAHVEEHMTLASEAILISFPKEAKQAAEDAARKDEQNQAVQTTPSQSFAPIGEPTTTSQPLSSDAPQISSGT